MNNNVNHEFSEVTQAFMTGQQLQAQLNEIQAERGALINSTQRLTGMIGELVIQNAQMMKKKRKSGGVACIVPLEDRLSYVQFFDDQTKDIKDLTINLIPDFTVYKFKFDGISMNADYFGIYFKTADFYVVDEISECNGKKLRRAFVKNGVIFNAQIPKSKVENLLEDFFLPKIFTSNNMLTIPALAGWYNGNFFSEKDFAFRKAEGLPALPICTKKLQDYEEKEWKWEEYFREIRKIKNWRNRCWVMFYPIAGMLGSLLEKRGIYCEKYINMVMLTDDSILSYCRYFQIFNRKKIGVQEPIEEIVYQLKDEIFMMDACPDGMLSQYKQNQKVARCRGMAEKIVKGDVVTEDGRRIHVPTIVFSDQMSRSKYAVNIFIDEDFCLRNPDEKLEFADDVFGNVFVHMLNHFKTHYDDLVEEIESTKADNNSWVTWFDFVYKIEKEYWDFFGIDMEKMAGLPSTVNYQMLLGEGCMVLDDDIISDGITVIRQGIKEWVVRERKHGEGCGRCILYDEENIMIPTKIMYEIFQKKGLPSQICRKFLVETRTKGQLKTDSSTSLSRQIQVGNKIHEVYQFKKDFFTRIGLTDIVDLGKEETDA